MGGNAFPDLNVPRLSPEEYDILLASSIEAIKPFYNHISVAPEAPAKQSYGDIDILVSEPKESFGREISADKSVRSLRSSLSTALQAIKSTHSAVTTSFAVPHPSLAGSYAQVDVHQCPPGKVEWDAFLGGYGDLVQIIGVLNRPAGLTMNNLGLHFRIPEVEKTNRKAAMVLLTDKVSEVCEFLGLDWVQWQKGFQTEEEIFRWCAAGRYYGWSWNHGEKLQEDEPSETDLLEERRAGKGGTASANDRKRFKLRPMFARFFKEWLDQNHDAFKNEWPVDRETVIQEALNHFGVRDQYDTIMKKHRADVRQKAILAELSTSIPYEGERLKETIKGVKRFTKIVNGKPTLRDISDPGDTTQLDWLSDMSDTDSKNFIFWAKDNHVKFKYMEKHRATGLQNAHKIK